MMYVQSLYLGERPNPKSNTSDILAVYTCKCKHMLIPMIIEPSSTGFNLVYRKCSLAKLKQGGGGGGTTKVLSDHSYVLWLIMCQLHILILY